MVFSGIPFLFYFLPAVLILYYTVFAFSTRGRNVLLAAASLLFYAWGEPEYVILLIISCLINWLFGILIHLLHEKNTLKRFILTAACLFNIGILFYFKYLNFTVDTLNNISGGNFFRVYNIIIPMGISFFTLQALSYVIDVYRGKANVQKNPLYIILYISLFPKLIAGPIVKYTSIESQLINRKTDFNKFSDGMCRFIIGLGKKLLFADTFAIIADNVFNFTSAGHTQMKVPMLLAWTGSFAYTLQIYYAFSGYSDMAAGLGRIFGFEFGENFNYPYSSKSVSEFWDRWHISLSEWFKEYVYAPLGGSGVTNGDKMVRNLFIVCMLTGIWYGASWTFVLWGLWNFVFILLERLFLYEEIIKFSKLKRFCTLLVINTGWVIFRAEDFYQFIEYIKNMLGMNSNGFFSVQVIMFIKEYLIFWVLGVFFCIPHKRIVLKNKLVETLGYPVMMCIVFFICVVYLVKSGFNF